MTREEFRKLCSEGTLMLDGATGSNLMRHGMQRGVCAEKWVLEHPDVLIGLQRAYVDEGSRIVCAPTFGANRTNLSRFHLEGQFPEMNRRLVALSREAVGDRAYVAGDVTTTGQQLAEDGGTAETDEVFEVYREQISELVKDGVDMILIETMISENETIIAVDAARSVAPDIPLLCTATVEGDGRMIFGGNVFDMATSLTSLGADAVGMNCSLGPVQMTSMVKRLTELTDLPIIAKPNAGMPEIDDQGNAVYPMGADDFAQKMMGLVDAGASIIGGCCGSTPEFIRKMRMALRGVSLIHR